MPICGDHTISSINKLCHPSYLPTIIHYSLHVFAYRAAIKISPPLGGRGGVHQIHLRGREGFIRFTWGAGRGSSDSLGGQGGVHQIHLGGREGFITFTITILHLLSNQSRFVRQWAITPPPPQLCIHKVPNTQRIYHPSLLLS